MWRTCWAWFLRDFVLGSNRNIRLNSMRLFCSQRRDGGRISSDGSEMSLCSGTVTQICQSRLAPFSPCSRDFIVSGPVTATVAHHPTSLAGNPTSAGGAGSVRRGKAQSHFPYTIYLRLPRTEETIVEVRPRPPTKIPRQRLERQPRNPANTRWRVLVTPGACEMTGPKQLQ